MENIIIIGASGHGKSIVDGVEKEGKYKVVGFIDSYKSKGMLHCDYPVLGAEEDLPQIIEEYEIIGGIIAIGDNCLREFMVDRIREISPNFSYLKLIHPSAIIAKNVTIKAGTVIMAGVIINSSSIVGEHCILNTNASLGHDCVMSNFSSLAPRVGTGGNTFLE